MPRLTLVAASSTAATAAAAFPADEPLDARGAGRVAGVRLASDRYGAARAGPSRACRETADGLALAADVDEELRDWDAGRWRGRGLDDVATAEPEAFLAWMSDPGAAPHGGESLTALLARVTAWLAALPEEGSLVAVVPVAVVRATVVMAMGAPAAAFWRCDPPPLTATVLHGAGDRWTVRRAGAALPPRVTGPAG